MAALIVAPIFFIWGFQSNRHQIFPYELLLRLAQESGLVDPPRQGRHWPAFDDEELLSLPYAERSFDPRAGQRGVVLHDDKRAYQGVNFYSSRDLPAAFLVDMEGELLHQWRRRHYTWQHMDLLPTGHVLVIIKDQSVFEIDTDSEIVWEVKLRAHHDLWVTDDGLIYVLTRKRETIDSIHPTKEVLSDYVTILSADGEVLEEISIYELLLNSDFAYLLPQLGHRKLKRAPEEENKPLDPFHTNHVEVFDGSQASHFHAYEENRVLLSIRELDASPSPTWRSERSSGCGDRTTFIASTIRPACRMATC